MKNNKQSGLVEVLLLIAGVTAIFFVGIFYLITTKKQNQNTVKPVAQIIDSFSSGQTTVVTAAQLEEDFADITLDDINQDFTGIDSDLNSL